MEVLPSSVYRLYINKSKSAVRFLSTNKFVKNKLKEVIQDIHSRIVFNSQNRTIDQKYISE